jgi:hypothetical protein
MGDGAALEAASGARTSAFDELLCLLPRFLLSVKPIDGSSPSFRAMTKPST